MPSIDVHRKRRQEYLALISRAHIFKDPHDLLQLYHECIIWIIDTYGAADPEIIPLLEDATSGFMEEERVWDESKYIELWELYAEFVGMGSVDGAEDRSATRKITTTEVYDTVFELGIGRRCARLYRRYMELLEEVGRITEAWEIAKKAHAQGLDIDSDSDDDSENEEGTSFGDVCHYESELNPSHFDHVSGVKETFTLNPHQEDDDEPSLYNIQRLTTTMPSSSFAAAQPMDDVPSSSQTAARASLVQGADLHYQLNFKSSSRQSPPRLLSDPPSDGYSSEYPPRPSNVPRLRSPLVEEYLRSSKRARESLNLENEEASLHFLDLTALVPNPAQVGQKKSARITNQHDTKRSRVGQLQEICRDYLGFSGGTVVSLSKKRSAARVERDDEDEELVGASKAFPSVFSSENSFDFSRLDRVSPPFPPRLARPRAPSPPPRASTIIHTTIRVIEYARKRRSPSFEVLQYRRERKNATIPIIPSPLNPSASENPVYWERLSTILKKRGKLPRVYDAPAPPVIGVVRARRRCETQACASDRMRQCSFCREDAGRLWKKVCLREHRRRHFQSMSYEFIHEGEQPLVPGQSSDDDGAGLDEEQMFFARLSDEELASDPPMKAPQQKPEWTRPPRAEKPSPLSAISQQAPSEPSPFQYAPAEIFAPATYTPRRAKAVPAPVLPNRLSGSRQGSSSSSLSRSRPATPATVFALAPPMQRAPRLVETGLLPPSCGSSEVAKTGSFWEVVEGRVVEIAG